MSFVYCQLIRWLILAKALLLVAIGPLVKTNGNKKNSQPFV
jgi:hypothetical protein